MDMTGELLFQFYEMLATSCPLLQVGSSAYACMSHPLRDYYFRNYFVVSISPIQLARHLVKSCDFDNTDQLKLESIGIQK